MRGHETSDICKIIIEQFSLWFSVSCSEVKVTKSGFKLDVTTYSRKQTAAHQHKEPYWDPPLPEVGQC